jgi:hypothetical protein
MQSRHVVRRVGQRAFQQIILTGHLGARYIPRCPLLRLHFGFDLLVDLDLAKSWSIGLFSDAPLRCVILSTRPTACEHHD